MLHSDIGLLVVMVGGQIVAWWILYDVNGPFLKPIIRWINSNSAVRVNVVSHMMKDMRSYGISDQSTMVDLFGCTQVAAPLHHCLAFLVTWLGYYRGSGMLFRLGVSFEIGEDLLHYAQMAVTALTPAGRGIAPWKDLPGNIWVFIGLHHLIGTAVGTFAFLYGSDVELIQLLTAMLLFCVVPQSLKLPLQFLSTPSSEPSVAGKLYALIDLLHMSVMLYFRSYRGLPISIDLTRYAFRTWGRASGCFVAVFLVGVAQAFFVVSAVLFAPAVYRGLRDQFACRRAGPSEPS